MALNANQTSVTISASTTSASAVIPHPSAQTGVRVHNASTAVAFVRTGTSAPTAVNTDQFIGAGDTLVLAKPLGDTHIAVILSASTGNVYVSPCSATDVGE